jgi:hypothetical protein
VLAVQKNLKNNMKYLFLLLLLASCSTRKVETNKEVLKEENKIELTDKTISKTEDTTSTKIVEDDDILIIEPVDSTKEMVIDGKKYKNARLKHQKKKVVSDIQNKKIIEIKADIAVKKEDKKESVKKGKVIKRTSTHWLVYIIILIIIVGYAFKNKIVQFLI